MHTLTPDLILVALCGLSSLAIGGLYGLYVTSGSSSSIRSDDPPLLPAWYVLLATWCFGCAAGFLLRHWGGMDALWSALGPWVVGPGAAVALTCAAYWLVPFLLDRALLAYCWLRNVPPPQHHRVG